MGLGCVGRFATQIAGDDGAEGGPGSVRRGGDKVFAEMAVCKARDEVDQPGEYGDPCGLKVQGAAPAILVGHDVAVTGGNCIAR